MQKAVQKMVFQNTGLPTNITDWLLHIVKTVVEALTLNQLKKTSDG